MATKLFDLESNGLLDTMDVIHSLVIKDADTGEVLNCHNHGTYESEFSNQISIEEGLEILRTADCIVGHNIVDFDIPGIQLIYPDWKPEGIVRDTLILSRMVYPDMLDVDFKMAKKRKPKPWIDKYLYGRHSLESWGQRLGLWKGDYGKEKAKEAKEKGLEGQAATDYVWGTWSIEMQEYCVQDVEVTERVWQRLSSKNFSEDSINTEHVVHNILRRQEKYGFGFNEEKARILYDKLAAIRFKLEKELIQTFKPWYRNKGIVSPKIDRKVQRKEFKPIGYKKHKKKGTYLLDKEGNKRPIYPKEEYVAGAPYTKIKMEPFNPGSRHDIANRLQVLFGWKPEEFTEDGHPKLDETILKSLPYPEAKLLNKYMLIQKRIGQLAEGKEALLKHSKNGRIHGKVNALGAVTHRMTHSKPNIAQVPSGKSVFGDEFRELFIVAALKKLVGCDADALELRCLAGYMARYDGGAYIKTVLEGNKDNGTDMHTLNANALGCSRDDAKTWFYAFIYGSGDQNLGSILYPEASASEQKKAGARDRAKFLEALPALKKLVERVTIKANTAKKLKGLDGRILPVRSGHSALNTLLQSAGAILMKKALVILDENIQELGLTPGKEYEFVGNIHDEWQIEVDEEYATQVGELAAASIRLAGEALNFLCPTAGNYDIGNNWKETH